jgi:OmpA-OmpF porin, OOP family
MASILAELRKLVTPELISEASRQTHEPDAAMTKAYDAAIPAYAATIANRSDDHGFMSQLVDLAAAAGADQDPVKSAMRFASSPTGGETMAAGGWMSSLFGQNLSRVTHSLARYAGIRESSASELLLTCAPLVLGYLGRLIRTDSLSASELAERLQRERPQIASALPAGFEMPGIVRQPYETTRGVVDEDVWPREPRWDWAVPLAALLAAIGIVSLVWWGRTPVRHQAPTRAKVETTAPNAVGTTGTFDRPQPRALPAPPNFAFPAGSTEDRLANYLASPGSGSIGVNLDRVGFESGSARLTPQSQRQIANIAAVLRTYPKTTVVVAGHTDNVGSAPANVALSRARAETIARQLRNGGVAADRVRVEAYGSEKPMADNSSEDGRSQNRRVTLDVTP